MAWREAFSLVTLTNQINTIWDDRDHRSDGVIGDAEHRAEGTGSDHNPDAGDVVRAADFDNDLLPAGMLGPVCTEALRSAQDDRIKYVIYNRRIFYGSAYWAIYFEGSGARPWIWYPYYGTDPHTGHWHISVVPGAAGDDPRPWVIEVKQSEDVDNLNAADHKWMQDLLTAKLGGTINRVVAIGNEVAAVRGQVAGLTAALALHTGGEGGITAQDLAEVTAAAEAGTKAALDNMRLTVEADTDAG